MKIILTAVLRVKNTPTMVVIQSIIWEVKFGNVDWSTLAAKMNATLKIQNIQRR